MGIREGNAEQDLEHRMANRLWVSRDPQGTPPSQTGTGYVGAHQPKVLASKGSSTHHEHTRLLPIHEALRDGIGRQNFVSKEEKRSRVIHPRSMHVAWNIRERATPTVRQT